MAMTKEPMLTLVVSNSGTLQNGLSALLTTIPQISPVFTEEELSSVLRLIENHQPALTILDMSRPEVKEVIRQIKVLCPLIQLIVLVDNVRGQKEVEELGVDRVLLRGFPAQKLVDIVEKLVDQRESISPNQMMNKGGTKDD
jgi:DNA-binding NarL/FixJ family response regulator